MAKTVEQVLLEMSVKEFAAVVDADLRTRNQPDGYTKEQRERFAALRSPEVAGRWLSALVRASRSVDGQLGVREVEFRARRARTKLGLEQAKRRLKEAKRLPSDNARFVAGNDAQEEIDKAVLDLLQDEADYMDQRSRMLRFKTGLDEWITEARSLVATDRASMYDSMVADERNHYAAKVRELEAAIVEHRDNFPGDEEPSKADKELWLMVSDGPG